MGLGLTFCKIAVEAHGGVSHDRYFLDRIVTRIVEIQPPGLVEYPDPSIDYWTIRRQRNTVTQARRSAGTSKTKKVVDTEEKIDALEQERVKTEEAVKRALESGDYRRDEPTEPALGRIDREIERLYEAPRGDR